MGVLLFSIHGVLGCVISMAVGPVRSETGNEEDLQAWPALYCEFMFELQGNALDAPFTGHAAYFTLPIREAFFTSSLQNTAPRASILDGGIAKNDGWTC